MAGHAFLVNQPSGILAILRPVLNAKTTLLEGETLDEREIRSVAKTCFEIGRTLLELSDMPQSLRDTYKTITTKETELEWCRGNLHFVDYTGTPKLTSTRSCPVEDIPSDRVFRDAWEDSGTAVQVNLPKARGIHMNTIRAVRNAELVKKDITFMRAVESGDTSAQSTIATEKQVLRDIPQTFDLTTDTPEQLKARWPSELPARE